MIAAAGAGLTAIALAAISSLVSPDRSLPVVVLNCYTGTPDFSVSINGRSLPLMPPAKRNDSVAVCYDGNVTVGTTATVVITRGRDTRRFPLSVTRDVRVLEIDAHALTAKTAPEFPMLD